jgi:hypothetical protein
MIMIGFHGGFLSKRGVWKADRSAEYTCSLVAHDDGQRLLKGREHGAIACIISILLDRHCDKSIP